MCCLTQESITPQSPVTRGPARLPASGDGIFFSLPFEDDTNKLIDDILEMSKTKPLEQLMMSFTYEDESYRTIMLSWGRKERPWVQWKWHKQVADDARKAWLLGGKEAGGDREHAAGSANRHDNVSARQPHLGHHQHFDAKGLLHL